MRIFEEEQRFNPWWLFATYGLVLTVLIIGIHKNSDGFTKFHSPVIVLFYIAAMIPMAVILSMKLKTRIDQEGIRVRYAPLGFSEKFFSWGEVEDCYVRKYNPLTEYGGYAFRSLGWRKGYNVSGNLGIQIVTHDKKNFLIGTNEPNAVRAVIKNYESKIKPKSNKILI